MAKFNEDTAWTALTAPVDTDWLLVCDASADVVKIMDISYLLVALDGDHLDIDFTPTYYTPATTPAEADDVDDLAAHLYGIDQKLGERDKLAIEQADTTFTVSSTGHYIEIDTSGGAVTATLPSAATLGAGAPYIIKVTDATAATTIATNGAETIDGADSWGMTVLNEVLEIISDGTNWKLIRWELPRPYGRPQFTYTTASSFTVGTFTMRTPTMDYPKCYVKAAVTVYGSSGGGGSNANNSDIDTTGWHYLYIDASAVDTQGTPLLDADCFLLSTDEPDWDSSYGCYVGDGSTNTTTSDICIFAVRFSAASVLEKWIHDGGRYVSFRDSVADRAEANATTWEDVTLTIPAIASMAKVTFGAYQDAAVNTETWWRMNGTSDTGHTATPSTKANGNTNGAGAIVITNANGEIEVLTGHVNLFIAVETDGWFLPRGM